MSTGRKVTPTVRAPVHTALYLRDIFSQRYPSLQTALFALTSSVAATMNTMAAMQKVGNPHYLPKELSPEPFDLDFLKSLELISEGMPALHLAEVGYKQTARHFLETIDAVQITPVHLDAKLGLRLDLHSAERWNGYGYVVARLGPEPSWSRRVPESIHVLKVSASV